MATLGKQVKGTASVAGAAGDAKRTATAAKTSMLHAKLSAMNEVDMARKLTEQAKRILVERFKAEEEASKTQAAALQHSWLHILRAAKTAALRSDVELLAAQHERDCAHRDASLRSMFDDLMAAEEQYRVALFNHMRQMDRLIELQDVRITDLESSFDSQLRQLTNDFHTEMSNIQQQHVIERRELRSLIATITEAEEAKAAEAEHSHVTAREEIRNRSTDRIQELSRTLDDRIMELESAFEQAHVNYLHATDAKTASFKSLVEDNSMAEKSITQRAERVERAKAALVSLRNKMAANAREYEEKNASLAREKAEQAAHVAGLKARLDAFRAQSDARLQKLSVAVRSARSTMDSSVALASRILQAAERCRQLEGEGDKIWAMPIPDVAAGAEAGSVIAGPAAATRAGAAMLSSSGEGAAVLSSTSSRAGASESADMRAATATVTSGALVPMELTAARHGFVPRADSDAAHRRTSPSAAAASAGGEEAGAGAGAGVGSGGASPIPLRAEALDAAVAAMDAAAYADVRAAAELESRLMRETVESGELDALELFWRRYNKALMDKLVLERRRDALRAENEQLQAVLRQCMDGTMVTDATMKASDGNPLFVVNGRTGINPAVAAALGKPVPGGGGSGGGRPVHAVAIDAGMTVRAYAVQAGGVAAARA